MLARLRRPGGVLGGLSLAAEVLAPDVVVVADGGGVVSASLHPVVGAHKVGNFLSRFSTLAPGATVDTIWLNGSLGMRIVMEGELDTVASILVEDGRISRLYAVRTPAKLDYLGEAASLAR